MCVITPVYTTPRFNNLLLLVHLNNASLCCLYHSTTCSISDHLQLTPCSHCYSFVFHSCGSLSAIVSPKILNGTKWKPTPRNKIGQISISLHFCSQTFVKVINIFVFRIFMTKCRITYSKANPSEWIVKQIPPLWAVTWCAGCGRRKHSLLKTRGRSGKCNTGLTQPSINLIVESLVQIEVTRLSDDTFPVGYFRSHM